MPPDDGELTLRFEEAEIDISVFEKSVAAFLGLVRDALADDTTDEPAWRVTVRQGSTVITARASGRRAQRTREVVGAALQAIREGRTPVDVSRRGLQHIIALGRATTHHRAEIALNGTAYALGSHVERFVFIEQHQVEGKTFGSLEGVLDGTWVELKREFRIKTRKRMVRCTFPPNLLPEVRDAMGKRASVYGEVHYTNGEVTNIVATRVRPLDTPARDRWRAARGALRP